MCKSKIAKSLTDVDTLMLRFVLYPVKIIKSFKRTREKSVRGVSYLLMTGLTTVVSIQN